MRFDPEDYAFVARYSPNRLTQQVTGLAKQGFGRLLSVAVGLVFVVFIWWQMGAPKPGTWSPATQIGAAMVLVMLVVAVVVTLVEKAKAVTGPVSLKAALLVVLLVASGGLLWPVWQLRSTADGYAQTLRGFADGLSSQSGQAVDSLVSKLGVASVVLLVALIVAGLVVVAAIVTLVMWYRVPRALGWPHRAVMTLAVWTTPIVLGAAGLGVLLFAKVFVAGAQTTLDDDVTHPLLPDATLLNDWVLWLIIAGLIVTVATVAGGDVRLATAAIVLARLPQGNALRVDALGVVVDDAQWGPQRVPWTQIGAITGRAHQSLPGPELVIGRGGQPNWSVPFMFLDVLPGTIDSAVRANTANQRQLDLCPLDKVV